MEKQVGKTKDVGFQFGIRQSFVVSAEKARDFMFSDKGLKIWLGDLKNDLVSKENYLTQNGIEGFVRVFKPNSHIRINWKKKDWTNISTVQVRIIEKGINKSIISFHQEKLVDVKQREEMKKYWSEKMDRIASEMELLKIDTSR